jgi:hypothetical protein
MSGGGRLAPIDWGWAPVGHFVLRVWDGFGTTKHGMHPDVQQKQ